MWQNLAKTLSFSFALLLCCGSLEAVEYFPLDPAATFDYTYGPVSIVACGSNQFARLLCGSCIVGSWVVFTTDPSGNVYETEYGSSSRASPDPTVFRLAPYPMYLNFPLETGNQWQSTSAVMRSPSEPIDSVTIHGTVVGPKTVTVPAGTFEVIEVVLNHTFATQPWLDKTEVLWLHRQLGPVNGLESWTGVVSSEALSWGALKANYR